MNWAMQDQQYWYGMFWHGSSWGRKGKGEPTVFSLLTKASACVNIWICRRHAVFWCMGSLVTVRECISYSLAEPGTELSCTWKDDNNWGCLDLQATYRPWEFPFPSPLSGVGKHGIVELQGREKWGNSQFVSYWQHWLMFTTSARGGGRERGFPESLAPVPWRGGGGWSLFLNTVIQSHVFGMLQISQTNLCRKSLLLHGCYGFVK